MVKQAPAVRTPHLIATKEEGTETLGKIETREGETVAGRETPEIMRLMREAGEKVQRLLTLPTEDLLKVGEQQSELSISVDSKPEGPSSF